MADTENTVDVGMPEASAADDAQQAQLGEALSTITEGADADGQNQPSEPGWIKGRVNAAVTKAVAEAEARIAARYEAQIAELQAERLDRQARDLVQRGEFRTLDTAKEYLQLKSQGGYGQPTDAREQQESEEAQAVDPVIQARADLLAAQAHKIRDARGIDVMAAYNADPEIQRKLASGEWDFYDVADQIADRQQTPAPVRRSNGARTEPASIRNMNERQWRELNRRIDSGGRFRAE